MKNIQVKSGCTACIIESN